MKVHFLEEGMSEAVRLVVCFVFFFNIGTFFRKRLVQEVQHRTEEFSAAKDEKETKFELFYLAA